MAFPAEGEPWALPPDGLRRRARRLVDDLRPFPGRLHQAVLIGAICAVSCVICMMYHFPEAAIGCYLVIFLSRANAAENVAQSVGIIFAVSGVVFLLIGIINLTIDSPPMQMVAIVVASFIFLYADSATKAGEQAGIVALVIAFVLTLLGDIPEGEIATRAVLYAWAMVFVPMATMAVLNLLFGIAPQRLLRERLAARLRLAAEALEAPTPEIREALEDMLGEGIEEPEKQLKLTALFNLVPKRAREALSRDQTHGFRMLMALAALPDRPEPDAETPRQALAEWCRQAAAEAEAARPLPALPEDLSPDAMPDPALADFAGTLSDLAQGAPASAGLPAADPFLARDAFTNPMHLQFALKTTLAAVTCYVLYTGADWQGIHTAMITCYVAALGTTGETVHKLILRISGCLLGAALGLIAVLWVIPQIDGPGGLGVMIFTVVAASAWVSTGSERISYGGVQIALAFLLTTLQGFGPGTSLSSANDRIFGILLGNTVVYAVFSLIWPISVSYAARVDLGQAMERLKTLAAAPWDVRRASVGLAAALQRDLGKVREALDMAAYEPRGLRPPAEVRAETAALAEAMGRHALTLSLRPDPGPEQAARLAALERRLAEDYPPQPRSQTSGEGR